MGEYGACTHMTIGGPSGDYVVLALLSAVDANPSEEWPLQWLPANGFARTGIVSRGAAASLTLSLGDADFTRWSASSSRFTFRTGQYRLGLMTAAGKVIWGQNFQVVA